MSAVTKLEVVQESLPRQKIVVIDDEAMVRKIVQKSLGETFDVHLVENGHDAIRVCEEVMPNVILLDLIMPSVDGFELIKLFKSHSRLCDIPIINMSATVEEGFRNRARKLGASGFIAKPISVKSLALDIESIMHSISNSIFSKNNLVEFYIAHNTTEKEKRLVQRLLTLNTEGEKAILLTWGRGDLLVSEHPIVDEMVDKESLILLEVKPTLITKFPYFQDLTPILLDILSFVGEDSRKYHLIFDEPRHLLNIHNKDRSIAQSYSLERLVYTSFKKIFYINSRPHAESDNMFLNKVGNILTGAKS